MDNLSLASLITLYVLTGLYTLIFLGLWWFQIMVLRGKPMQNPDGTYTDWKKPGRTYGFSAYGFALADTFVACPLGIIGAILVVLGSRWGVFILALVSFFAVWVNIATTVTSLKFNKPKITVFWFVSYPLGTLLGIAFIIWTIRYFDVVFLK